jgi:hypothetical protein
MTPIAVGPYKVLMINRIQTIIFVSVVSLTLVHLGCETNSVPGVQSVKSVDELIDWRLPVAAPTNVIEKYSSDINELVEILGTGIVKTDRNPECAFWIEVGKWNPNPEGEGYVVVIESGGATLSATDQAAMRAGIAHIKKVLIRKNGRTYLPRAVLTNYPVIP